MEEKKKPYSRLTWLVVGLVLLPVAYPLSVGPAVWLSGRGYLPMINNRPMMDYIYQPVFYTAGYGPPVISLPLNWYIDWWASW